MKCVILLLSLVSLSITVECYDEKLDKIDIESLVSSHESMMVYTLCFLDKGPCPEIPLMIKHLLPEIIGLRCAKCSPKFAHSTRRYYEELEAQYPEKYEEFKKKYDHDGCELKALRKAVARA